MDFKNKKIKLLILFLILFNSFFYVTKIRSITLIKPNEESPLGIYIDNNTRKDILNPAVPDAKKNIIRRGFEAFLKIFIPTGKNIEWTAFSTNTPSSITICNETDASLASTGQARTSSLSCTLICSSEKYWDSKKNMCLDCEYSWTFGECQSNSIWKEYGTRKAGSNLECPTKERTITACDYCPTEGAKCGTWFGTNDCVTSILKTCGANCGSDQGWTGTKCGFLGMGCQCQKYQTNVCNANHVCAPCVYTTWILHTCVPGECATYPIYSNGNYSTCQRIYSGSYVSCDDGCDSERPDPPEIPPSIPSDVTPPSTGTGGGGPGFADIPY